LLEANYKVKLDELVRIWTDMCKDVSVDIVIRLRVLEIIELRTAGWRGTQKLKEFYQHRISKFENSKGRESPSPATKTPFDSRSVNSSTTASTTSKMKPRQEPERLKTTIQDLFPDGNIRERECIIVDGVKLFISSASPKLLSEAKMILSESLAKQTMKRVTSNVRYSREDLLSLSKTPTTAETPFKVKACSCPEIVIKGR